MEEIELLSVRGGAISGTLINAAIKALSLALELGRSLGSAIRRSRDKTKC